MREEIFDDDPNIATETKVRYSVTKRILAQPFYLLMITAGAFAISPAQHRSVTFNDIWLKISGVLFCIIGIILTWQNIKQLINRTPQIIISDEGLALAGKPFHSWLRISNLHIVPRGVGVRISYYLQYDADGKFDVKLDSFNISHDELRRRLQLHRSRFMSRQVTLCSQFQK